MATTTRNYPRHCPFAIFCSLHGSGQKGTAYPKETALCPETTDRRHGKPNSNTGRLEKCPISLTCHGNVHQALNEHNLEHAKAEKLRCNIPNKEQLCPETRTVNIHIDTAAGRSCQSIGVASFSPQGREQALSPRCHKAIASASELLSAWSWITRVTLKKMKPTVWNYDQIQHDLSAR